MLPKFVSQTLLSAASFCAFTLVSCHQSSEADIVTIPIKTTSNDYPIPFVTIEIEGIPANLALDTGSIGLALTAEFVQEAGFELSDRTLDVQYPDGNSKILSSTTAISLTYAETSLWSPTYAVIDVTPMSETLDLDGNFDPRWLTKAGCAHIDFPNLELNFAAIEKGDVCPFRERPTDLVISSNDTLIAEHKSQAISLIFDTGLGITSVTKPLTSGDEKYIGNANINWIWGKTSVTLAGSYQLKTDEIEINSDSVAIHESPLPNDADGMLGFDVLSKYSLTIDERDTYRWRVPPIDG